MGGARPWQEELDRGHGEEQEEGGLATDDGRSSTMGGSRGKKGEKGALATDDGEEGGLESPAAGKRALSADQSSAGSRRRSRT